MTKKVSEESWPAWARRTGKVILKKTSRHDIYEVWSEWEADSVFIDHKPSRKEVYYLWKNIWPDAKESPKVFKLKPLYVIDPKQRMLERGED